MHQIGGVECFFIYFFKYNALHDFSPHVVSINSIEYQRGGLDMNSYNSLAYIFYLSFTSHISGNNEFRVYSLQIYNVVVC